MIGAVTPLEEFRRGIYKVREAGTIFLTADPFGTVLHPDADTDNFTAATCADTVLSLPCALREIRWGVAQTPTRNLRFRDFPTCFIASR